MKKTAPILISILMGISAATAAAAEISHRQEIEDLASVTDNLPEAVRAGMIVGRYRFFYPTGEITSSGVDVLRARFDAADVAVFYSHDDEIASELLAMYKVLFNESLATPADRDIVAGAQILTRSFENIADIPDTSSAHGAFDVPVIESKVAHKEDQWQVLEINNRGLTREARKVDKEDVVVIISSPLCGFSKAASDAIEKDDTLSAFFSKYGLWLVPPMRRLHVNRIASWNELHPTQMMALAYKTKNWPIIDDWSTPVFYFVSNGIVVDKVVGWPKDGRNIPLLRAAISRFDDSSLDYSN